MTLIKTKHNRRSFLKVSAAAGGGLVLGFNWLVSCTSQEELSSIPEEWFNINAFLKIGDNGIVTIYSPNPEAGQNVKTSMPMIVAEELDIAWKDVVVEQANLDTDKYRRQVAGGSQSIRQGWQSLRMAGATARRLLLDAAAKQWSLPVDELTTEDGAIKHSSGKSAGYGELASLAATLEIPEEVELKEPKDFKIIGQPTKNVDGQEIVTGKPLFGLDYEADGMLIAMLVHPPSFGLKIKSLDGSVAKGMPGIVDVFRVSTLAEGEDREWGDARAFPELAVVVGKTTWQVMKAKQSLNIDWERVTPAESTTDHVKNLTELLSKAPNKPSRKDGDVDSAFKNAAKVIERTYSAPFLPHNPMEPMNFYANVTETKAELAGPIQTPESMRNSVAKVLGLNIEDVTIEMTRIGGGFGRRLYGNYGIEAAVISKKAKAPVKLVYTREDDITHGTYRPAYKVRYKAAIDENNKISAFHIRGAGIHGSPVFSNRFPAGTVDNYLAETHGLDSNISTGAWRAPRSNFIAGAEASFLDELAEELGKDPIDLSLELFESAINNPIGKKNDYDPKRYKGVINLLKEKANWGSEQPGVHRGFAAYYCHNSYVAEIVDVKMENNKPVIAKVWCSADCGIVINPEGAKNQLEGGIIDGIGHAMYSALTVTDGKPDQDNFTSYKLIKQQEAPLEIESFFVENEIDPTGLGEPGLPPAIGALANALYKATGKRYYNQPFALDGHELGVRITT
ncbi:MAG: molybdopterin cofactor-binding domain-containing protein [Bacteroidota bacterium]